MNEHRTGGGAPDDRFISCGKHCPMCPRRAEPLRTAKASYGSGNQVRAHGLNDVAARIVRSWLNEVRASSPTIEDLPSCVVAAGPAWIEVGGSAGFHLTVVVRRPQSDHEVLGRQRVVIVL